jgi:hypothetical protein
MDTPFPLSIMEEGAPVQVELNRLRTMMSQLVFRLRRVLLYDTTKLDASEANKLEDAAINELISVTGMPAEAIHALAGGVFPQELLQYHELLEADMRGSAGQSKMGRGERINVESASEATFVQQGQDVNTARIADAYEDFNKDIIRLYMQGRRATMDITGSELVRIVGEIDADGMQQWATVDPDALHGDFELQVVHGSTRKRDKAAEAQAAAGDFEIAMNAPQFFRAEYFARKLLEARGIPPEQGLAKEALVASAVLTLDQIRRDAQIGEEGKAEPGFDPGVAQALAQGSGQQQPGPNGGQGV